MLEAGGMDIFTDKIRNADDSNPKGYYEHETVKKLQKNKSWVKDANGKVVKVIAHLLPHLPTNYKYKIVFMERDLSETIRSQQAMLTRQGKNNNKETYPLSLHSKYEKSLQIIEKWAKEMTNVEILYCPYKEVIKQPLVMAMNVCEFLGNNLDPYKLIQPIEPSLYREKNASKDQKNNLSLN